MLVAAILTAVACLAYANGANDNFKGVATLFGSGSATYRTAIGWATAATFAGSIAAAYLAGGLLKAFTGSGLVPKELAAEPSYAAAVALAAAATVFLATRLAMPVSTTHALVGALVGAGIAAGAEVAVGELRGKFLLPLLLSPALSFAAILLAYPPLHRLRRRAGLTHETCFCVGTTVAEVRPGSVATAEAAFAQQLSVRIGAPVECRRRYSGRVVGVELGKCIDALHFLSAGAVSFARGLNDTPKIAALLVLAPLFGPVSGIVAVGLAIGIGGLLNARRIAETMGKKITPMNHGQGFAANGTTAAIVIVASLLGSPVSTTHVSCGTLFGLGLLTRQANAGMIAKILGAWLVTLPLGATLGYVCRLLLARAA